VKPEWIVACLRDQQLLPVSKDKFRTTALQPAKMMLKLCNKSFLQAQQEPEQPGIQAGVPTASLHPHECV